MDPSPFHEQDLDRDAEEFILSWAQEFPLGEPVALRIHLEEPPRPEQSAELIARSVHHYFSYRATLNDRELHRLWRDGRTSLLIGLSFMAACLLLASLLPPAAVADRASGIVREGLTIAGWVAMWRPMQIYLYDWWPLRRRGLLLRKMSRLEVQIAAAEPNTEHGKAGNSRS